jgi:hypothetical protein
VLGRAIGIGTILPDPEGAGVATNQLFLGDATVVAPDPGSTSTAYFVVTLLAPLPADVTMAYLTLDGTATAGVDYIATSGTATIAAGSTSVRIPVQIAGAVPAGITKSFSVTIANPTGGATITRPTGSATIIR